MTSKIQFPSRADELARNAQRDDTKDDLPSFLFSDDSLELAESITLSDLLQSRIFAPYVLTSLMNASKRLKLYRRLPAEERILLGDAMDITEDAGDLNRRACFTHVRDCGLALKALNQSPITKQWAPAQEATP